MQARSDASTAAGTVARLALGLAAFVLVAWGVGELWLAVVGSTEDDYMQTLAAERSHGLIEVARVVTWAGSAVILVPLCLVCCAVLARAGRPRDAVAMAVTLGGAMLIYDLVKGLVGRSRPGVQHLQHVTSSSFPSGHSTQAAAFWTSLVLVLVAGGVSRVAAWLAAGAALVLILGVAWSRVYLGVHFPADVIAGLVIGLGWAVFARWAVVPARSERGGTDEPGVAELNPR
jgi:undecaprenyl-diphosphatase